MVNQPKAGPMEESTFFKDGAAARALVAGTVPRGGPLERFAKAETLRMARPDLTKALLERGRERYDIFCAVCHGRDGSGNGMVVQRGFPQAASHHLDRLRSMDDAYVFSVITEGYNNMPAYGPLIAPRDRWAIVAYFRALQLSQNARIEDVPVDQRGSLEE